MTSIKIINIVDQVNLINASETLFAKPKSYQPLKLNTLPQEVQDDFLSLTNKLVLEPLPSDASVCSLYFDENGLYEKPLPLPLCAKEGKLALHFGVAVLPINLEHEDLNFSISEFTFDKYSEVCLTVYDDVTDFQMNFPLRLNEETYAALMTSDAKGRRFINTTKLVAAVNKKKWDVLIASLKDGKTGSSTPITNLQDVGQQGVSYPVVGIREVPVVYNGQPNVSYIITININGEETSHWLPNNLKPSAALGLIVAGKSFMGFFVNKPAKPEGKPIIKGFLSSNASTNPKISASPLEPTVKVIEAKAVAVNELPFKGKVEAIAWAKTIIPNTPDAELQDLLATSGGSKNFYDAVQGVAATQLQPKAVKVVETTATEEEEPIALPF